MLIVFWIGVSLLLWAFVMYPTLTLLRGMVLRRPHQSDDQYTPSVSVLVAAYNEEDAIGDRLRNLLAQDYPQQLLQLVVASDGSSDRTVEIAREFETEGVEVLDLPRAGKIPAVNAAMQYLNGDILVMTDANSDFKSDAIRQLVKSFADPTIGGVAGNQVYAKDKTAADGEHAYWNLDRALKLQQSRAGSVISATGAIYAMRKSLVQTIPSAVTDDFFLSTGVIEAGKRLVFNEAAIAVEPVAPKGSAEFARKVRVMTRGFRSLWMRKSLMNPLRTGYYAIDLISYKLLKRLLALPLLAILISSCWLARTSELFWWLAIGQTAVYAVALISTLLAKTALGRLKPIQIAAYLVMTNTAALIAIMNSLRGRQIDRWEPQRQEATA